MASRIVSADTTTDPRTSFLAHPRGQLCMRAAWEIDAISCELQRRFCADDCPAEDLALRALSIRLALLASTITTCVSDGHGDIETARRAIEGPEMTRRRLQGATGAETSAV